MKIKTVTITGADNHTDINEIIEISNKFPFVEWGILFSPNRQGSERYPGFLWLHSLIKADIENRLKLSAHLCGLYTRQMLLGDDSLIQENPFKKYLSRFNRFQLNFNSSKNIINEIGFFSLLNELGFSFILQYNYSNIKICNKAIHNYFLKDVSFLYDSSGGRGNMPTKWFDPIKGHYTGYAGGLSPLNLDEELNKIPSGENEIWIDTETGVRTNGFLDMKKVESFLEIASKYTNTPTP